MRLRDLSFFLFWNILNSWITLKVFFFFYPDADICVVFAVVHFNLKSDNKL